MWLLLGAAATLSSLLGERIPLNRGFGFEAFTVYKPITEHLPEYVARQEIDSYTIQRVLPFVAAHYTLRVLGLPLKGRYIIGFFQVYDLVALALAVWLWLRLARDHNVSASGQWLGFLGLFVNFAVMKLTFYYPVNIDTTALLLGLATLHAYQRDSLPGLLVVCLAGLFVWPTTILIGSLLLLFPPHFRWPERPSPTPRLNSALLLLVTLSVVVVFAYSLYEVRAPPPSGGAETVQALLPLSLATVAVYLYYGLRSLLGPVALLGREAREAVKGLLSPARLMALALLWTTYLLATRVLAAPGPPRLTASDYVVKYVSIGAAARPAQFLVAHVAYYGPLLLLLVMRWPAVARRLRRLGAGLSAAAALALLLGVNSESRQLVNFLPLLILPTVLVTDELLRNRALLPTMAAFAVILSKSWFPVNYAVAGLGKAGASFPTGAGSFLDFPAQAYFMNFGPWMSNSLLALHAAVVVAMGLWLQARCLRAAPAEAVPRRQDGAQH